MKPTSYAKLLSSLEAHVDASIVGLRSVRAYSRARQLRTLLAAAVSRIDGALQEVEADDRRYHTAACTLGAANDPHAAVEQCSGLWGLDTERLHAIAAWLCIERAAGKTYSCLGVAGHSMRLRVAP